MSEEKTYTIEEAMVHGRKVIARQAKILKENLQEKRKDKKNMYV